MLAQTKAARTRAVPPFFRDKNAHYGAGPPKRGGSVPPFFQDSSSAAGKKGKKSDPNPSVAVAQGRSSNVPSSSEQATTEPNNEWWEDCDPLCFKTLASFVSAGAIMGLAILIVSQMDCNDPGFGCLGVLYYALMVGAALSIVVTCLICCCCCGNDRDKKEGGRGGDEEDGTRDGASGNV